VILENYTNTINLLRVIPSNKIFMFFQNNTSIHTLLSYSDRRRYYLLILKSYSSYDSSLSTANVFLLNQCIINYTRIDYVIKKHNNNISIGGNRLSAIEHNNWWKNLIIVCTYSYSRLYRFVPDIVLYLNTQNGIKMFFAELFIFLCMPSIIRP